MKHLIHIVSAVALTLAGTAIRADPADQFDKQTADRLQILQPFIEEASERFGVPHAWIRAVIVAESGGRTVLNGWPITSLAGAIGPMQVMPGTYDELQHRYGLGPNPADPGQNILAGTAYLKELWHRFGRAGMFAAYNAGPARYQAYLDGRLPLPEETRTYLATLGNVASGTIQEPAFSSGRNLFFAVTGPNSIGSSGQLAPTPGLLFFALKPAKAARSADKNRP